MLAPTVIPVGLALTVSPWALLTALLIWPLGTDLAWKAGLKVTSAQKSVLILRRRREAPSFWMPSGMKAPISSGQVRGSSMVSTAASPALAPAGGLE